MNAVLATDMTQHMRLLDAFSQGRAEQPDLASWRDTDVLLQLVLHTADLCNPCRQVEFSIKWGELICKEFLEQVRESASSSWNRCVKTHWEGVGPGPHPPCSPLQHHMHVCTHTHSASDGVSVSAGFITGI